MKKGVWSLKGWVWVFLSCIIDCFGAYLQNEKYHNWIRFGNVEGHTPRRIDACLISNSHRKIWNGYYSAIEKSSMTTSSLD